MKKTRRVSYTEEELLKALRERSGSRPSKSRIQRLAVDLEADGRTLEAQKSLGSFISGQDNPAEELNAEKYWAFLRIESATKPVLVTGNAGTGKSYLIDYIRDNSAFRERLAIAAPTGTAAVNVRGQTLHSMFGLMVRDVLVPKVNLKGEEVGGFRKNQATRLIAALEMLIIDEISMVRADVLDTIDRLLRLEKKSEKPFGGVKIVMFGDLYQLPPITKPVWLASEFAKEYSSPFAISAKVLRESGLNVIALNETFRQDASESEFKDVLSRIRLGTATQDDFRWLNENTNGNQIPGESIRIFAHRKPVRDLNLSFLEQLPGEIRHFRAGVFGKYRSEGEQDLGFIELREGVDPRQVSQPDSQYPAEFNLFLKPGARVMFVKNNPPLWVNGTLGTLVDINADSLTVELDSGEEVSVEKASWPRLKYVPFEVIEDGNVRTVLREEEVGNFVQFPVQLAWAATIHKVQGQTYDHLHLDLSQGTFSSGQAYVALSRVRSVSGLVLASPAKAEHVKPLHAAIVKFFSDNEVEVFDEQAWGIAKGQRIQAEKEKRAIDENRESILEKVAEKLSASPEIVRKLPIWLRTLPSLATISAADIHYLSLLDEGVDETCSAISSLGDFCVSQILERKHTDERLKVAFKIFAGEGLGGSVVLRALETYELGRFRRLSYPEKLKEANSILERRNFIEIAEFIYQLVGQATPNQ